MLNKVQCPKCGHLFELSEAVFSDLENELTIEFEEYRNTVEISAAEDKKKLREELLEEKQNFIKKVAQETSERLQEEFNLKSKLSQNQLELTNKKYLESQEKIQKLLLEKASSSQVLEEERIKLLEENNENRKKLEVEIQTRVDGEHRLKNLEKEKIIQDQKDKLAEMSRKLDVGSQQLFGEVLELDIESRLQAMYPLDKVKEILKGVAGADIKQTVMNKFSQECGLILIETKNTKEFARKWISKLRDNKLEAKADVAILLTSVLPTDVKYFTIQDGIIICNYDSFFSLLGIFRNKLIDIHGLKLSNQSRSSKLEILYDHVTDQKFIDKIQLLYNLYSDMKNSLDTEKNSIKRSWGKREVELKIFSDNVNSIWSELNAITNVFPEDFGK
jgi:hypothetical protein